MPHSYQVTEHINRYNLDIPLSLSRGNFWQENTLFYCFKTKSFFSAMLGRAADIAFENTFVFCNFNQVLKLDRELFGVWMNILKKVDNSVM